MLKEAYNAKKLSEEYGAQFKELRTAIIGAVKGMDEKILTEGEYTAKVKYVESCEYIDVEKAQKVLPKECFRTVIDKDIVKALEKSGKLDKKTVDGFRKYSYTKPRVTVDKV